MNCEKMKNIMADYLLEDKCPEEFEKHMENCPACRTEFEQMKRVVQKLKPSVSVRTSDDFVSKTINKLNREDRKMKRKMPFAAKIAAAVSALVLVTSFLAVVLNTHSVSQVSATPAYQILAESLTALSNAESMDMEMKIRAVRRDNFELIGTDYDFIEYRIRTEFVSPQRWKIEKPGRTVLYDGQNQYLDIEGRDYILKGRKEAGFVGWLQIFLTPGKILEIEKKRAEKLKGEYIVKEERQQLIVTVMNKAQGDFTNDYLKNSSVEESDTKRVFRFDKKTNRLLSFELYILKNNIQHLVMKTTKISYDDHFAADEFDVKTMGNKAIKDIAELNPKMDKALQAKTPEEMARYFFEACSEREWDRIKDVFPFAEDKFKAYLGGVEIIEIGKSFTSGRYAGVFVPYTIKLKSGEIKKHNLALRNDNPQKIWVVDGGI